MKSQTIKSALLLFVGLLALGCGTSIKVADAWKSPESAKMKDSNILVIARTQNKTSRMTFERELTDQLLARGLRATASFSRFPNYDPDAEMTEERQKMIRFILENEGYDGVVVSVLKDKRDRTVTTVNDNYYGGYYGGPWNNYYPSYYGGFYNYYYRPYAYTYSVGISTGPTSSTYTSTTYYLETAAYDLRENKEGELMAVVTSEITDPNDVHKTAAKYAQKVVESLEKR